MPDVLVLKDFSVSKKFFQRFTRLLLPGFVFRRRDKFASNHFKIFAVISHVLFRNRIRPAIPALFRHPSIITHTIQAHFQIGSTRVTTLRTTWRPR